jgi:hypothetical protein
LVEFSVISDRMEAGFSRTLIDESKRRLDALLGRTNSVRGSSWRSSMAVTAGLSQSSLR